METQLKNMETQTNNNLKVLSQLHKQPSRVVVKDLITAEYQREKYGYAKDDYWTDLTEEEQNWMMGITVSFVRLRIQ